MESALSACVRYWRQRGEECSLHDQGFLVDPASRLGGLFAPRPQTLEELASVPCLVLLGVPGMGKSTVIEDYYGKTPGAVRTAQGNTVMYGDLARVTSDKYITDYTFAPDTFQTWIKSGGTLTIALDALDECILGPSTTVQLLKTVLDQQVSQDARVRLSLRIACRTADWPVFVEQKLKDFWGEENVEIVELCPLRRDDVVVCAQDNGVEADQFIDWVVQKRLVPMAARPITLPFLIGAYRDKPNAGDASQVSLYRSGTKELCSERSKSRLAKEHSPFIPAANRLSAAKRLAILSILGGKKLFASPSLLVASDPQVLSFQEAVEALRSGIDSDGYDLHDLLCATYDSGLFSGAGEGLLSWAHSTYAEFLAAQYFLDKQVPPPDVQRLLSHDDLQTPIVQQLQPLATWLSTMLRPIHDWLRDEAPELLLAIDTTFDESDDDKRLILAALLRRYSQPDMLYAPSSLARAAVRLSHPGIVRQLRGYLRDSKLPVAARELAVLFAGELGLAELVSSCLKIALDGHEPRSLRERAVGAVARSGNTTQRKGLRRLVDGATSNAASVDVLGAALEVLWKSDLTPAELFASLVLPRNGMMDLTYERFLRRTLPSSLCPTDLRCALEWIATLDDSWLSCNEIHPLINAVMRKTWELAGNRLDVFPARQFAVAYRHLTLAKDRALFDLSRFDARWFFQNGDATVRHKVAAEVLGLPDCAVDSARDLFWSSTPVLGSDDFEWVIKTLSETPRKKQRGLLTALAWVLFQRDSTAHIDLLLEACGRNTDLRRQFRDLLQPVRLGSLEARRQQADFEQLQRMEEMRSAEEGERAEEEKGRSTLATIQEVVSNQLAGEHDDPLRAWALVYEALYETANPAEWTSSVFFLDVTRMEAWELLDKPTQANVVACARSCLESVDPGTERWVGTNQSTWAAFYGVRALVLLIKCADASVVTISDHLVARWLPALLVLPDYWCDEEKPGLSDILSALAARCPGVVLETARCLLSGPFSPTNPSTHVLERLELVWSNGIAQLTLETAGNPDIGDEFRRWCLTALLNHKVEGAREIADSIISHGASESSEESASKTALSAAVTVMQSCNDWWNSLWPVISDNPLFGRLVILKTAGPYSYGAATAFDGLTNEQMGIFYIWLTEQFPEEENAPRLGGHFVTDAEWVYELRHRLLEGLRKGESQAAVDALRKIRNRFPTHIWLPQFISESESNLAARVWTPVPVKDLCALLDRPGARYVATEEQLLNVVGEQIRALQLKLHGETPMWRFLWNDIKEGERHIPRPKEEADISDWVKDQLESSLAGMRIVVNREVEIRRGTRRSVRGERTDIKVDATSRDEPHNHLRVIVEVKGCWNPGLGKDMERQLGHRYLAGYNCSHGVYLVGWFNWEDWDCQDARRTTAFRHGSKNSLQEALRTQADELKTEGLSIAPVVLDFTPRLSSRSAAKHKGT